MWQKSEWRSCVRHSEARFALHSYSEHCWFHWGTGSERKRQKHDVSTCNEVHGIMKMWSQCVSAIREKWIKTITGANGEGTVRNVSTQNLIACRWQPCTLRFPSFLPHRFSGGVFRWFYKVLGLPGASGRGLNCSRLARLILDDFGGRFGAHLGPILELILGAIFEGIDGRACNIIMKMILLSYDVRTKL